MKPDRENIIECFTDTLKAGGGKVLRDEKNLDIRKLIPENAVVIEENQSRLTDHEMKETARDPRPITFICRSGLAVAENGAVWLDDDHLGHRALPFVSEQVIIFVKEDDIVWDMHRACEKLGWDSGFGVFVAGPSKTADIEQNLVIGAHGPAELIVVISKNVND